MTTLPSGYTELRYIESSGTQYIDTGFKHNQNTRIIMDVQATTTPTANAWIFGGRIKHSTASIVAFYYHDSSKLWSGDYSSSSNRVSFSSVGATDRLSVDFNKNVLTINGISNTIAATTFQSTYSMALLACNTSGAISGHISAKLYSCQIYDNGTLVRNFIPCKNSSGTAGLYDLVTSAFYGNAGTGSFVAGPTEDTYDLTQTTALVNLLTYGAFEGTGWSGGSWDTTHKLYGNQSYKLTGTASVREVLAQQSGTLPLDNTHKYYVRWHVYHEGASGSTGCYWPIAEPYFVEWRSIGPANQWNMVSAINSRPSFSSGSYPFRFDFNNANVAGTLWIDGGMCIDLTAYYGAGNEPSKEWLDSNIPFFTGSLAMPKIRKGDIINVPYSGSGKGVLLPKGTYSLKVWGAQGGYRSSSIYGGKGGVGYGHITLDRKIPVYCYSGGAGNTGKTVGGFNGGGRRATYNGGGGGSDIRVGMDSLHARIIVAGGGGSDGSSSRAGGVGGGTTGQANQGGGYGSNNGPGNTTYSGSSASTTASSQSANTSSSTDIYGGFGFGGNGVYHTSGYGGAGGGGWYGGSGTYPDGSGDDDKSGSGGSGYAWQSSTKSQYPSGCLLEDPWFMTSVNLVNGAGSFDSPSGAQETGHTGDGYCQIVCLDAAPTVKFMDGSTVVEEIEAEAGMVINAPDYDPEPPKKVVWKDSSGAVVTFPWTFTGSDDVTFTCELLAIWHVKAYDSGTMVIDKEVNGGTAVALPVGSNGTGTFVGWWNGTSLLNTSFTPTADTTLYARYDASATAIVVDSVGLQPNPVGTGATVLVSVMTSTVQKTVPRWSGVTLSYGAGLPMSSPFQTTIWDTSEPLDWATFEGTGIRTAGMVAPPLSPMTVPLPRVAVWSSGISDANGDISFTISGTGTNVYTSSVIVTSSDDCYITAATIEYTNGSTKTTADAVGSGKRITLPPGTYTAFTITVTKISKPFCHVRVLDVAPGGA